MFIIKLSSVIYSNHIVCYILSSLITGRVYFVITFIQFSLHKPPPLTTTPMIFFYDFFSFEILHIRKIIQYFILALFGIILTHVCCASVRIFSFFMDKLYMYIYNLTSLFTHIDRHLDCFHVLAIKHCCYEHWGTDISST